MYTFLLRQSFVKIFLNIFLLLDFKISTFENKWFCCFYFSRWCYSTSFVVSLTWAASGLFENQYFPPSTASARDITGVHIITASIFGIVGAYWCFAIGVADVAGITSGCGGMATTSFVSGVAWVMDIVIFAGGEGGELSNWSGVWGCWSLRCCLHKHGAGNVSTEWREGLSCRLCCHYCLVLCGCGCFCGWEAGIMWSFLLLLPGFLGLHA